VYSSRQGNALFAAFNSTSLCCLSLRGIPAAAARAHLAHRLTSCCLCHPRHLNFERGQVTAKRGVSSRDAGEEPIGTYLRRPRVLLPVGAYSSALVFKFRQI